MLKFGDLALQPIDFCEQSVHAFDVVRIDGSDTATGSCGGRSLDAGGEFQRYILSAGIRSAAEAS